MSDAPFQSQDSQADWTALGDRMRRNRTWLLMIFVGLGAYMAAQGWARMRRDGIDLRLLTSNLKLTGSTPLTPLPASPTEQPAADPAPDLTAKSPPTRAPADAGRASHAPDGRQPVSSSKRRPSQEPLGISAHQPPSELIVLVEVAESAGQWLAAWQCRQEDSRREGWRVAAAALARYARRPTREVGVLVEAPPPEPVPPPKIETSVTQPPALAAQPTRKSTASGEPDLSAPGPGLSIHNSSRTRGVVRYLVNGQDQTLRPGESQKLPAGRWLIEFHRGGPYGDTAHTLATGSYRFEIGARGWELLSGETP